MNRRRIPSGVRSHTQSPTVDWGFALEKSGGFGYHSARRAYTSFLRPRNAMPKAIALLAFTHLPRRRGQAVVRWRRWNDPPSSNRPAIQTAIGNRPAFRSRMPTSPRPMARDCTAGTCRTTGRGPPSSTVTAMAETWPIGPAQRNGSTTVSAYRSWCSIIAATGGARASRARLACWPTPERPGRGWLGAQESPKIASFCWADHLGGGVAVQLAAADGTAPSCWKAPSPRCPTLRRPMFPLLPVHWLMQTKFDSASEDWQVSQRVAAKSRHGRPLDSVRHRPTTV